MTTVLITGATDGLGRGVAQRLAAEGATLLLHGRNPDKLERVVADVRAAGAPEPRTFLADLADLGQVRRLAAEVEQSTDRLDALLSNAGVGFGGSRQVSADGYELRFAVNYLAGFLLTSQLLALLRRSAPARVVFVASLGQSPLDFDDLEFERGFDSTTAYNRSKLAQIMSVPEFAARVPADEVTFTSLHPGTYMPTQMVVSEGITPIDTLDSGVEATVRLLTDSTLQGVTGRFFNRMKEGRPHRQAAEPAARAELWRRSRQLVGLPDA